MDSQTPHSQEEKQKTRDLPIHDYFLVLQKEFIIMEVRSKIYQYPSEKEYYKNIMAHKRGKIEDIGKRNNLDHMFNDESIQDELQGEMIPKRGLPNFLYRDQKARDRFEQSDIEAYYRIHADVKVYLSDDDSDYAIGQIVEEVDIDSHMLTVKLKGDAETTIVSKDNVVRIL